LVKNCKLGGGVSVGTGLDIGHEVMVHALVLYHDIGHDTFHSTGLGVVKASICKWEVKKYFNLAFFCILQYNA
jgi:hypothetical protein